MNPFLFYALLSMPSPALTNTTSSGGRSFPLETIPSLPFYSHHPSSPDPQLTAPTVAPGGGATVTILPTQVVVGSTTLTRAAPGILISNSTVSLAMTALILGTSTIAFPAAGPAAIYTVNDQVIAVGPAGVAIAGTTISNNGPAVTVAKTLISLGSSGLVFFGGGGGGGGMTSTFVIPTVQPLVSTFMVGGQEIMEEYGRIIFPVGTDITAAATGTGSRAGLMTAVPFMGAAAKVGGEWSVFVSLLMCAWSILAR